MGSDIDNRLNMTEELYKRIWQLSPNIQQQDVFTELTHITKELVHIYALQGRLDQNPFEPSISRTLSLPFSQINQLVNNGVCLVTGGLGCVGTVLVNELLRFDVKQVVVLDIATAKPNYFSDSRVHCVVCDIKNGEEVLQSFAQYKPQFVFHTAAQRSPGYAERHAVHTFQTNVTGTLNVANACEQTSSVQQCVFSSTGKASRYFTNEVYAQTKKICEYIFDVYARTGRVLYSMTRFTHIIDNSLMNDELEADSRLSNYIAIHSPGKYVTAQNAKEAALLMLNCLVYSQKNQSNFLIVKNLEWPVESLEVALYYIQLSKRDIPVIFKGNPPGYIEKFFRGQLDWSQPNDLNLLINVYEYKQKRVNSESDIIVSHICPVERETLMDAITTMKTIEDERELKQALTISLITLVKESLLHTDKQDTVNILNWGLQKKYLLIEKMTVKDYGLTVPLLADSLQGTEWSHQIEHLLTENKTAETSFTH